MEEALLFDFASLQRVVSVERIFLFTHLIFAY